MSKCTSRLAINTYITFICKYAKGISKLSIRNSVKNSSLVLIKVFNKYCCSPK